MQLANTITKQELSSLLNIEDSFLLETKQGLMKGFELQIQFSTILKKDPVANSALPNLSKELIYDYQIRFNAANYTIEELKNYLNDNCLKILNYLTDTLVKSGVSHEFIISLVEPTTQKQKTIKRDFFK